MDARAALLAEVSRIRASTPPAEFVDRLDEVNARIDGALAAREACSTQAAWRAANERLHDLYVLQHRLESDRAAETDPERKV